VGGASSDLDDVTFQFVFGYRGRAMADAPELGFDQILVRLRDVVSRLESGELSLEQSLAVYEEGVALARKGQQLLVTAEKRVEILVSTSGQPEIVPFEINERDAAG